jgi:hypothetical protein
MRRRPNWHYNFLTNAADASPRLDAVVDLVRRSGGMPQEARYRRIEETMIRRMAIMGQTDAMRTLYMLRPGANAATLRDARFSDATVRDYFPPVAWEVIDGDGQIAEFQGGGTSKPELLVEARDGGSLAFARRMLFLAPGRYTVRVGYERLTPGTRATIMPRVACWSVAPQPVWFASTAQAGGSASSATFTVPADCTAQRLELSIENPGSTEGADFAVADVTVTPAR